MPLYRQPKSPYWWIRFSVGGVKVRRSSGTTDRTAAHELAARLRAELWRQHKLGERPRYTWKEAVERWKSEATGRDRDRDASRLSWFAQYLDDVPLAEITPTLIAKLRTLRTAEAAKKGRKKTDGKSTANRYMALLRMLLRKAQREWDWLDKVPPVPMVNLEKREPRFITRVQAAALLKALAPLPHLQALAEFCLETGLRMRNATGLTWPQLDLRRQLLIIPAARAKAGETIAIPLSSRAMAILKAQRGQHETNVFTFKRGPNGKALPLADANGAKFKAAAKAAGVPWLRWHDLRHTWASWHIQAGTPPHVLQELGGWKSYDMVRRYGHLTVDHLRAFAEHRKGIPTKGGAPHGA
jgi:integrase